MPSGIYEMRLILWDVEQLFGWERKIEAQINEKRDGELKFIRKKHMFGLLSNNVK